jgi:hypothetical protein
LSVSAPFFWVFYVFGREDNLAVCGVGVSLEHAALKVAWGILAHGVVGDRGAAVIPWVEVYVAAPWVDAGHVPRKVARRRSVPDALGYVVGLEVSPGWLPEIYRAVPVGEALVVRVVLAFESGEIVGWGSITRDFSGFRVKIIGRCPDELPSAVKAAAVAGTVAS